MAMFAAMAALAGTQIAGGFAASRESKANADIYQQQAHQIDISKGIESLQYDVAKRQVSGKIRAGAAARGLEMSGSPMEVLLDNMTNLELDKSIGQYNLEVQKRQALTTASMYKRQAGNALFSGFSNAFSTLLSGSFDYASRKGLFNMGQMSNTAMIRDWRTGSVRTVPVKSYRIFP